ncbi:phosphotransferase family protein [Nocardia sp. NPDC003963]
MIAMSDFRVLEAAAAAVDLDISRAVLIRSGENAVFGLPGGIVARVGVPGGYPNALNELRISLWLNRSGVSAVRAVEVLEQPVLVADRAVTWWRLVQDHRPGTPGELGSVLRRLHSLDPPSDFRLPDYQPFAGLEERIVQSAIADEDRLWLLHHLDTLRQRYEQLPTGETTQVIHGDAWQGNVAVPPSGQPVLLDLDKVSIGNPEWDLVQLAADHLDFDRLTDKDYRTFVDAYGGRDITVEPDFRVYADIQELRWTVFAVGRARDSPRARSEALRRLSCLRGAVQKPWTWAAL